MVPRKVNKDQVDNIVSLYKEGVSTKVLSKKYGISRNTVYNWLERREVEEYKSQGRLRISESDYENIKNRYKNGDDPKKIANDIGISYSSVHKIINNSDIDKKSQAEATRDYSFDEHVFENPDKEGKYWVGFIMADGYVLENNHNESKSLGISISKKDKNHLYKFREFLNSNIQIRDKEDSYKEKDTTKSRILVTSSKIVNDLSKFGIKPNKSGTVKAKNGIDLNKHFWRGVIDGDGCLRIDHKNNPRLSLAGSYDLIKQFESYCQNNFNTKATANQTTNDSTYSFEVGGCYLAPKAIDHFYNDSDIFLDRKKDKANQILNRFTLNV